MAQLDVLAQILARCGRIAAVSTRCPRCGTEDGLIIRFDVTRLVRCVACPFRCSLTWLLRQPPEDRPAAEALMKQAPRRR